MATVHHNHELLNRCGCSDGYTQSGVSPDFKMLVPIYLEFADGKIIRLGAVHMTGPKTEEQTVNLPNLPGQVKRVSINYYYDVLAIDN